MGGLGGRRRHERPDNSSPGACPAHPALNRPPPRNSPRPHGPDPQALTATVPDSAAGRRFDAVLAELFPDYSRSRLSSWIKSGDARLDGEQVAAARSGARRRGRQPARGAGGADAFGARGHRRWTCCTRTRMCSSSTSRPGLVVHPGAGNPAGTLVNALLHRDPALNALPRAGIVHRLDKDTSGVMVVARTLPAHTALVEQLSARDVHRQYLAVVVGALVSGGTANARDRPPPARPHPHGGARGRPRRGHPLPPARALPRAHAAGVPPRNRPHAPDPRAHGSTSSTRSSATRCTAGR